MGPLHNSGVEIFLHFAGHLHSKIRKCKGRQVIWMAVYIVWVLWLTQNSAIFKGVVVDLIEVIATIKICPRIGL